MDFYPITFWLDFAPDSRLVGLVATETIGSWASFFLGWPACLSRRREFVWFLLLREFLVVN